MPRSNSHHRSSHELLWSGWAGVTNHHSHHASPGSPATPAAASAEQSLAQMAGGAYDWF